MRENQCQCDLCKDSGCMCEPYSRFFSTLGNINRLHIIRALRSGSKNVSEIIAITNLEQTCVSHCLKALVKNGFVTYEPNGRYRVYSLNKEAVDPLMKLIDEHVRKYCMDEELLVHTTD